MGFVLRLSIVLVLLASSSSLAYEDAGKTARPQLPRFYTTLDPIAAGVYDMKAEPVAIVFGALRNMQEKTWDTMAKYYPSLGRLSDQREPRVNPGDQDDRRFFANFTNEDPGRSPIPLASMIISLSPAETSGHLTSLREELLAAMKAEDYESWKLEALRSAIDKWTEEQTTIKGVKYRAPKRQLALQQSVQLYAMTVALLRKETKWVEWARKVKAKGYTLPPPPDMNDFANRLVHQLPVAIPNGETVGFLLYEPGPDIDQPVTKGEFEERADVVIVKRAGIVFTVEQFPIYLTVDEKQWNPAWVQPKDELRDTTLMARKYENDWTRFDGPYLWFRSDQLNGSLIYKATVRFQEGKVIIEADRFVSRRGSVVKMRRDPEYDPTKMVGLMPGVTLPANLLSVDVPDLELAKPIYTVNLDNLKYFFYRRDKREMLNYQTSTNSFSSSLYPPSTASANAPAATNGQTNSSVDNTVAPVKTTVIAPMPQR